MKEKIATTGRLAALNLKVPQHVRDRIEAAARESGRSMTQEATQTLLGAYAAADAAANATYSAVERSLGGSEMFALFQALAGLSRRIEAQTGKRWNEDMLTFTSVREAWNDYVAGYVANFDADDVRTFYGENVEDPIPPDWMPEQEPKGLLGMLPPSVRPDGLTDAEWEQEKAHRTRELFEYMNSLTKARDASSAVVRRLDEAHRLAADALIAEQQHSGRSDQASGNSERD